MIKAAIFDADGVLIVNNKKFSRKFSTEYKIPMEKVAPFFLGPFADCILGKADLKESILPYLSEWGWAEGPDRFLEYWFTSEHNVSEELLLYIEDLRKNGIITALATNQEKYRAEYLLEKMGFAENFDRYYFSAHLGHKKPSIEFFQRLIDDLEGIEKEEIIFWDDTLENIEGAKQFGIHAELYESFESFKQKMKNYLT